MPQTNDESGFIIRLAMKLSGGRLSENQIAYALIGFSLILLTAASIIIIFSTGRSDSKIIQDHLEMAKKQQFLPK